MKERKASADWYIATTHYFTFGAISALVYVTLVACVIFLNLSANVFLVLTTMVSPITVWLGVMYSANYIHKTYMVKNKTKIVNLSTIYLLVVALIIMAIPLLLNTSTNFSSRIITFVINVVYLTILAGIFYIASNKYIKNTSET
jgi:hypothetical protein